MSGLKGEIVMFDVTERIGLGTLIQHGPNNDRIYLMKLDERDTQSIVELLADLANAKGYSKIICKIPASVAPLFLAEGYIQEAFIPRFYSGERDALFVSRFFNRERESDNSRLKELNDLLRGHSSRKSSINKVNEAYRVRRLYPDDIAKITVIYKEVFESYPFPIHQYDYILKTMNEQVQYFGAECNGELAAIASSEIDKKSLNAEMTDFATSKAYRGRNLSGLILEEMEKKMQQQGIKTLYTIARLNSVAMNKTFLNYGYNYSGTLIKNTHIAGRIESMNVFYKQV